MTDTVLLAQAAEGLVGYLKSQINFTISNKEDSPIMKAIALGMDLARNFSSSLPTGDSFMQEYATTAATDIYLPKLVRDNPYYMISVVTHEAQHVLQFQDTGVEFAWYYLVDNAARAQFEADAYASGTAVSTWLTGQPGSDYIPGILESLIVGYHLKAEDITYAEAALQSHITSLAAGVLTTRTARMSIGYLEQNFPQLKGTVA